MAVIQNIIRITEIVPARLRFFGFLLLLFLFQGLIEIIGISAVVGFLLASSEPANLGFFELLGIPQDSYIVLVIGVIAFGGRAMLAIYCVYTQNKLAYRIQGYAMEFIGRTYLMGGRRSSDIGKSIREALLDTQQMAGGFSALLNFVGETLIFLSLIVFLTINYRESILVLFAGTALFIFFVDFFTKKTFASLGADRQLADDNKTNAFLSINFSSKEIRFLSVVATALEKVRLTAFIYADVMAKYTAVQQVPKRLLEFGVVLGLLAMFSVERNFENGLGQFSAMAIIAARILPVVNKVFHTFSVIRFTSPIFSKMVGYLDNLKNVKYTDVQYSPLMTVNITSKNNLSEFRFKSDNITIGSGQVKVPKTGLITICGESGVGKSLFLNELSEVYSGAFKNKKSDFAWLGQHPVTIPGTIYDNIVFFRSIDDSQVASLKSSIRKQMTFLQLDHLDLSRRVEQLGTGLSGGEIKRICLIRSFLHEPSVCFIDEPTAGLDDVSAGVVLQFLKNISRHSLLWVVTHDKCLVESSDLVLKVDRISD